MKIIKRGTIKKKSTKLTCSECESELEYTNEDVQSDRDGNYIICPVCKSWIAV